MTDQLPPETDAILTALDAVMKLHVGRENAIKFAALKFQVNRFIYPAIVGERGLRELIEEKRPKILFCTAAPGGHFLPSDDPAIRRREILGCVHSIDGYLIGAAKRKSAILRAYPEAEQLSLGI